MRIAYVCTDRGIPIFGCKGGSIHVQEVVRAWKQQGHQVTILAARLGGEAPPDLASVPVRPLPQAMPPGDKTSVVQRGQRELAELAANQDLAAALTAAGPFDLVYERYALWSFAAMEYAQHCGIPGVLEVNAPLIEEQIQHRELMQVQSARRVARRVFAAAAVLVAVSTGVADYLDTYPEARGRVQVVPNGVNPARFPDPVSAIPQDVAAPFTVGFVGTMKAWHGLPILAAAFTELHRHCPQARLLMVGEGPARPAIQATLERQSLASAVQWTGSVAPAKIPGLLARLDVAVAPYPDLENFYFSPLKVYEYMAAGRPVVASDLGQLRQLIQPEVTGLLCPPGDALALAHALQRLQHQPQLRHRLGQAARRQILAHHTWDQVGQRLIDLALTSPLGARPLFQEVG